MRSNRSMIFRWLGNPWLLAMFASLLFLLSVPGYGNCALFAAIALAPMYVALRNQSALRSFLIGWGSGSVLLFVATTWMISAAQFVTGYNFVTSVGILVLISVYQGLQFAIAAWLFWAGRKWLPSWLSFCLAFGIADALFPHFFPASYSLFFHKFPGLLQTADIAGHATVTLIMAVVNASVVDGIGRLGKEKNWRKVAWALCPAVCAIVFLFGYGAIRISMVDEQLRAAPKIRVAVVQPGVFPEEAQKQNEAVIQTHVSMSRKIVAKESIDLLVWSESLFNQAMSTSELTARLQKELSDISVPVMLGAALRKDDNFQQHTNSVVLAAPDGWICPDCRYDKSIFFPVGESHVSSRNFHQESAVEQGNSLTLILFNGHAIATYICFESLFPEYVRKRARSAELLVNPSYDGWFLRTAETEIHEALGRIRAIENRKPLVRAAMSGISAIVDPVGRTVQRAAVGEKRTITSTIAFMSTPTVYSVVGHYPWYILLFMVLIGAWKRRAE